MNKLFTLLEKSNTNELHLFKSKKTPQKVCLAQSQSICKKMDLEEQQSTKFTCLERDNTRIKCAEIGDTVCGTCVSNLYSNY